MYESLAYAFNMSTIRFHHELQAHFGPPALWRRQLLVKLGSVVVRKEGGGEHRDEHKDGEVEHLRSAAMAAESKKGLPKEAFSVVVMHFDNPRTGK